MHYLIFSQFGLSLLILSWVSSSFFQAIFHWDNFMEYQGSKRFSVFLRVWYLLFLPVFFCLLWFFQQVIYSDVEMTLLQNFLGVSFGFLCMLLYALSTRDEEFVFVESRKGYPLAKLGKDSAARTYLWTMRILSPLMFIIPLLIK